MRRGAERSQAGFTVIEVIVVVALVVALLLVTLPLWGRARSKRIEAVCKNNLTQIGFAFMDYADDNEGHAPDRGIEHKWDALIWPYIADDSFFECPADTLGYYEQFGTSYKWRSTEEVSPDHPQRALSGKNLNDAKPRWLILAFEASHGWHEVGHINGVTLNEQAQSFTLEEFDENLTESPK